MSPTAITLPVVALENTVMLLGSKEPVADKLPAVRLPRVYILPPLISLVAVTLPDDNISKVAITLPTLALPRVYKLLPLTTPPAVTFPDDNISSSAITLPPVTLPDTLSVVGSKVPLINKLPAVTLPRVYILSPVTTPLVVVILPYEIISSVENTFPPVTLPDAVIVLGTKEPLIDTLPAVTFPRVDILSPLISLVAVTLYEDITSSRVIILPTFALPRV